MNGARATLALAALAAVVIAASACGGREAVDDQGLHQDVVNSTSGAEVTFDATLLTDPVESGGHERFEVKATTGESLEIDHNTSLAPSVPVHTGDGVIIHGQVYIDPGPRLGVHCTHAHTSSGCPSPGWIEYANNYYE
jgi:UDP-3-O-[3-hydroxymyristoyl] glucosamine N-acyltransferase